MLEEITHRIISGGRATLDEALKLNELYSTDELCKAADTVRRSRCGNTLDTCSIVNARSGRCSEDCKWCAQSRHFSTGITEYEIVSLDEAMKVADDCHRRGVRRFSLVTSGCRVTARQIERFCEIFRKVSERYPELELCASMGLVDEDVLKALRAVGVNRYHCNLETSSDYFPHLCTTHTQADKLRTIATARRLGMTACVGGIIGMGETLRQRLQLIVEAYEAGAISIPINILNPIPGTPLENTPAMTDDEIVRSVALMRLVAPDAVMRFAGGRARLSEKTTEKILAGGMNGVMVGDLLTTVGNSVDDDYRMFSRTGYDI